MVRQTARQIARYTFDVDDPFPGFDLLAGIFAISQAPFLLAGKDADPPEARLKDGLIASEASNTAVCDDALSLSGGGRTI